MVREFPDHLNRVELRQGLFKPKVPSYITHYTCQLIKVTALLKLQTSFNNTKDSTLQQTDSLSCFLEQPLCMLVTFEGT